MSTCLRLPDLAFPVTLEQSPRGLFRVTYGKQVREGLDYSAAAKEFGLCVFHALACDGKLDNSKAL
jgi:hypothetical protein